MHTQKLKGPIAELGLKKKSLLFAELAANIFFSGGVIGCKDK